MHPFHPLDSGIPRSFVCCGKGLLGAKGLATASGGRYWVLPLRLPRWRELNAEWTYVSPAWPTSPGHSSAVEVHLLFPILLDRGFWRWWCQSHLGLHPDSTLTNCGFHLFIFLGFYFLIYKMGLIILMLWGVVGLEIITSSVRHREGTEYM